MHEICIRDLQSPNIAGFVFAWISEGLVGLVLNLELVEESCGGKFVRLTLRPNTSETTYFRSLSRISNPSCYQVFFRDYLTSYTELMSFEHHFRVGLYFVFQYMRAYLLHAHQF